MKKEIELLLRDYYLNKSRIINLDYRIKALENQIKELEKALNTGKLDLDTDLQAISYSGMPKSGHVISIDDLLIKACNKAKEEIGEKKIKLLDCILNRSELIEKNSKVESFIEELNNEEKSIIEGVYKKKKSQCALSCELCMSRATFYSRKKDVLNNLQVKISL